MNAGELIEYLSQYPKELKVLVWTDRVISDSPYVFGENPTDDISVKKTKMFEDDDESLSFILISAKYESF